MKFEGAVKDDLTFKECCRLVIENQENPALYWAVNYAKAGYGMDDPEYIRVQALYLSCNIDKWRTFDGMAESVKASLRRIAATR